MSIEERLRAHLSDAGQQLDIRSTGPDDISHRARQRTARRRYGVTAAAAAVAVTVGGVWAANRPAEQTQIEAAAVATTSPVVPTPETNLGAAAASGTEGDSTAASGSEGERAPGDPSSGDAAASDSSASDASESSSSPNDSSASGAAPAPTELDRVQNLTPLGDGTVAAVGTVAGTGQETVVIAAPSTGDAWQAGPPLASNQVVDVDANGTRVAVLNSPIAGDESLEPAITFADALGQWSTLPITIDLPIPHPETFWQVAVTDVAIGPEAVLLFGSAVLDIDAVALAPELANEMYRSQFGRADGRIVSLIVVDNATGVEVREIDLVEAGFDADTLAFLEAGGTQPLAWLVADDGTVTQLDHDLGVSLFSTGVLDGTPDGWLAVDQRDGVVVRLSADGATWTASASPTASSIIEPVVQVAEGLVLFGVNLDAQATAWFSDDAGLTWEAAPLGARGSSVVAAAGDSTGLAAVVRTDGIDGQPGVLALATSIDGTDWQLRTFAEIDELAVLGPVRVDAVAIANGDVVLAVALVDEQGLEGPVRVVRTVLDG